MRYNNQKSPSSKSRTHRRRADELVRELTRSSALHFTLHTVLEHKGGRFFRTYSIAASADELGMLRIELEELDE